jgi:hypothetical protein
MVLSTIVVSHNPTPYLELLKPGQGRLHILGDMSYFPGLFGFEFVFRGRQITAPTLAASRRRAGSSPFAPSTTSDR